MTDNPISNPRDPRALNAYRHGLTGQIHIVSPEEHAAYQKHCQGILASLAPSGAMETDLAQSIADGRWQLKRAVAIENTIFAMGLGTDDEIGGLAPEIADTYAQAHTWLNSGKDIALLGLYQHRIQRRVEKNMQMLRDLQQERKAALQQAAEEVALLTELAESKGETFDPDRDFPVEFLPSKFVFSKPEIVRLAAHHRRLAEAQKQFAAPPKTFSKAA
jgi:hypothetical protein